MRLGGPKNFKLRVLTAIGVLIAFYISVAGFTHLYARTQLLPIVHASEAKLSELEPRILADFKLLSAHPVYPPSAREKNAERFLSGFIGWDGASPLETPEHDRLVTLMKSHEHPLANDDAWSALLDDDTLDDLDLAWIDQLVAYDHINLDTHPAYADAVSRARDAQGFARLELETKLPFPAMSELRFAATARVAQLHLEDRNEEAQTLFRHVSLLFSTTDSLIGTMNSVSMLLDEKKFADLTELDWPLIDDARIQAMKRSAWAWSGIENILARRGSLGAFAPYFKRETNACATTFELYGLETTLQDLMSPTAPLEYDMREQIARQSQFKSKILTDCGHESLAVFMTPIESSPWFLNGHLNAARIPFARRLMGLKLTTLATPNYFRYYEENPREPASHE